jgi:gliding motility-associated-like protein
MKKLLLIAVFHCFAIVSWANHLVGGELFYTYKGTSAQNRPIYKVTLRFFRNMEANVPSIQYEPVYIGVYQNGTTLVNTITLSFEHVDTIRSKIFPACVNNNLQTIYEIGYFSADLELPRGDLDYTLAWIRCCRTNSVVNMRLNDGGITLTALIPGPTLARAKPNNSAVFPLRDTVLLCNNQEFSLEFGATDVDQDSLSYSFYPALHGASLFDPSPQPNSTIAYESLPYNEPQFTANSPMGAGVKLDARTGQISGVAPPAGTYLVTVRVFEWRNGIVINQHSKDILMKVRDCSYSMAQLKPEYLFCDSTITLTNEFQGGGTQSWFWDFGVEGITTDTSNLTSPRFTYSRPGTYTVTLLTNKDKPCPGAATTSVKVYPELKAGFTLADSCVNTDVQFTDTSQYSSGVITNWAWEFGEPASPTNISHLQNPSHSFSTSGLKKVLLIAGTDKGCMDTTYRELNILPRPSLSVLKHQLTGCIGDATQLSADGVGNFTWVPASGLNDPHAATPMASPTVSTTYYVTLDDAHCSSKDSVVLNVLARDAVKVDPVTPICKGDTVQLRAVTNAAAFQWTPASYISNDKSLSLVAFPPQTTSYKIVANPGFCQTEDSVAVTVLDRPGVDAGKDQVVKEGEKVKLNANGADMYQWLPEWGVSNPQISNPTILIPPGMDSVTYVVTGAFNNGCTSTDAITIHVIIKTLVDAPSAFTPNSDGKNDVFRPIVKGDYQLVDFRIYNRWGGLVFQTNRAYEGWKGREGKDEQSTDTFVWTIQARNKTTGKMLYKKGTVTLIR